MNIFYLDKDIEKCAEYHVDNHVVKMITEYNQLLCTTNWLYDNPAPYKKTHVNHPSAIWVRQSKTNYKYLCELNLSLCKEYTYRYDKIHAGQKVVEWLYYNIPNLPDLEFTEPTPAMPDDYKIIDDSISSYRLYYNKAKTHLFNWKKRNTPNWIHK